MPRERLDTVSARAFIPSGCAPLDLVMGGGWALGRFANIVGDKSSGKTLLAIEACANFAMRYDARNIAYREIESAFDQEYAYSLGMPREADYSEDIRTIEDFERDLKKWLADHKNNDPSLYILDSLDACSSEDEMGKDEGGSGYGTQKAKQMSQMFRKLASAIEQSNCSLLIISQIRDNIGVTFGETKTRSGGHALDFYASQIVWLAEIGKIRRTVTGVDRVVGVNVRARNKKNKVGLPFRDCDFSITFGYGIDDEGSMLEWLKKNKGESKLQSDWPLDKYKREIGYARSDKNRDELERLHNELKNATILRWQEIEKALEPPMRKYR